MPHYFGSRIAPRINVDALFDRYISLSTLMYLPEHRFIGVEIPNGASQIQLTRAFNQWIAVAGTVDSRYLETPQGVLF